MERAAPASLALVDRPERALCPLAMQPLRAAPELIGRPAEMTAIRQELATAAGGRLACVSIEGEPGIGKTRLMMAAQELAEVDGFGLLALAADEELRGPFMLARSLFGCRQAQEIAIGTPAAETAIRRAVDALSGRDDPALAELPPAEKLLRTYDLAAMAVAELADIRPLALLLDDLQWADEDSLRLLRYIVRSDADRSILIVMTVRPEEMAGVGELVNLAADMERQGFMRRLRLHRFTPTETGALLRLALGGQVEPTSAATIHGQAEGVPFIVEELMKAYREAGLIRQVDGTWTLSKSAARMVPSAVRTLIGRRAARLPDGTKALLADGGILGRSFSLQDLRAIREHVDGRADAGSDMAELLAPAVSAGLLVRYAEGSPADYGFPHEQVREFVVDTLPASRRRTIHASIVELLGGGGEPAPESLPMLAYHARAAGDALASARFAIEASREALGRNAPEEALRSVELGLPVVSDARDRVALLLLQDDALSMLSRSSDRLQALAEVTALADALADPALSLQLMLRRSAALRDSGDWETAAEVAREVRRRAEELADRSLELAAALELGQTLLHSPLGEAFVPTLSEVDADGAQEAYTAALELARSLGDDRGIAAASRELGAVAMAHVRAEYIDLVLAGDVPRDLFDHAPLATAYMEALGCFQLSLETYSRLGDRHGLMSAILGLAYATMGADFAISGAMRRLEEVRRLSGRLTTLATEGERIAAELQLLYGIHVRAREFGDPQLAISRGEEAHRLARVHGDRSVEFLAAGGMAMSCLQLGEADLASEWLERAADAAVAAPTPLRERRIAMWRGRLAAQRGDGPGMRAHLERAVDLATEQGKAAAICECLALLAIEAARLGREASDTGLLELAESAASRAIGMSDSLPGHPPWRARANAALTYVRRALPERGDPLETARAALEEVVASEQEELFLDIWSACLPPIIDAGDAETVAALTGRLAYLLGGVAEHTLDDDIRRRWFAAPPQSGLAGLLGGSEAVRETFRASSPYIGGDGLAAGHVDLSSQETELLRLMTEARSDSEIAATLGMTEEQVARQLAEVFGRMNAPSREAATAFALLQRLV
jgi:DNA-binding CsgD family transcriptional regulator